MKSRIATGLTAAFLAFAPLAANAQAVSPAVGRALQAARGIGRGSAAIAQINAARAAAKTPAERLKVAQMAAYVYSNSGDYAAAAQQLEATGAGPAKLAPYYYRAGQYDKAIATAKRAGGQEMLVVQAQSYFKKGDSKSAAGIYQQLIRTSGPKVDWLNNLASIQYKSGDTAAYLNTIRQLIRIDSSPAQWKALLLNLKNQAMNDRPRLSLYQLMRQTGNLTEPTDVQEMSKLAILADLSGVALGALQDAQKANVIASGDAATQNLVRVAAQRSAAAIAAAPRQPATPAGRMLAANAYFGASQYPQAAQTYAQVVAAKVQTSDEARMLQGIALIRAGNSAAAQTVLGGVGKGSDFNSVAQLWSLYAQTHKA